MISIIIIEDDDDEMMINSRVLYVRIKLIIIIKIIMNIIYNNE